MGGAAWRQIEFLVAAGVSPAVESGVPPGGVIPGGGTPPSMSAGTADIGRILTPPLLAHIPEFVPVVITPRFFQGT